jgi:penicillin-binding protein 1A
MQRGKRIRAGFPETTEPARVPSLNATPRRSPPGRRPSSLDLLVGVVVAFAGIALDALTLGLVGSAMFGAVTLMELPDTAVLKEVRLQEPLRVYSADGALMGEFGTQHRRPAPFDEIPPLLVNAFLATEDSRFLGHEGVDMVGIGRAAVNYLSTGERSQGGSTITMQVARNFFLTSEKTFRRKFSELLLALQIERILSKEEILELYLNKIFFGHRAYGVSAAAELYYGKPLDELNLPEVAMLAGVPKAPSTNNPVSNPKRARERRDYVLRRMRDLGYITEGEYRGASNQDDKARLHKLELDLSAGYAAELVRREMVERFGEDAYRDGYVVTTTFDSRLQPAAQRAVRRSLRDYDLRHGYHGAEAKYEVTDADDRRLDALLGSVAELPDLTAGIVVEAQAKQAKVYIGAGKRVTLTLRGVKWARPFRNERSRGPAPRKVTDAVSIGDLIRLTRDDTDTWKLSQIPSVAGALVSLSPQDGAVRALVGGYAYELSKFNRAVDARRQPGSSFKPFVYAAALNRGYTPATFLSDEPFRRGGWSPENFDRKTMGLIRMREALVLSRNLASVDLLNRTGLGNAQKFIRRFGFDIKALQVGLSMALGTAEVSPLQMAAAYALFANGGFRVIPHFISRIQTSAGELVYERNPPRACSHCWARYGNSTEEGADFEQADSPLAERVIDPRLAYQMTSMMEDVIKRGTGRLARQLRREDIAGKTGTTNDVRDSWFCGFQKDYVTVAWMGSDGFRPLGKGETGSHAGARMWVDFMREALENKPQATLDPPGGMVEIRVFDDGGRRSTGSPIEEWVPQEYVNAIQGPNPLYFSGGRTRVSDERF